MPNEVQLRRIYQIKSHLTYHYMIVYYNIITKGWIYKDWPLLMQMIMIVPGLKYVGVDTTTYIAS